VTVTVAILGEVDVRRDGVQLALPSGKSTHVLVRLALEAGRTVSADRLIDDLWASGAGPTDRNTLQSKVSQLRRAVGDPGLISSTTSGYVLNVDPRLVDVIEVLGAAEQVGALRGAGDLEAVVARCSAALSLFRGELLADCADPWLEPHRARLEQVRFGLLEEGLSARLELGASAELTTELETLVTAAPLRERGWLLLITALYRAGRQADALAAYRRVRDLLGDELGLEPGPDLQRLEQQVLAQDPALDGAALRVTSASVAPSIGNLPGLSSELVGRCADLRAVGTLVREHRLVTIVGSAGVGKTRLALEVARGLQAASGAWLVRLEGVREPGALAQYTAETLGVTTGNEAQVIDRLRGSAMLLVLDNCEHLADAVADLIDRFLAAAPSLRILATSQRQLGVDGETVYPLEPLSAQDAVDLFTQRAVQRRRSFVIDNDSAPIVDALCRSLDGLPLAIELAAARIKALSVQEISRRLTDRFSLLGNPAARGPERHRTLRAAIAWSYDLLFPDDKQGLWALSCFSDGAPLPAVEHVLVEIGVPAAASLDVIERLADRSFVRLEIGVGGGVRYRLLDSVREFAAERLREAELADVADRAHAHWFAAAADRAANGGRGLEQSDYVAMVKDERSNIDAALSWAAANDPLLGLRIVNGFGWVWVVVGDGVTGAARIRAALGAAESLADPADRTTALMLSAWLEASAGNVGRANAEAAQAIALADESGQGLLPAVVRWCQSFVLISSGRPADALELLDGCRPAFHALGDRWHKAGSALLTGHAYLLMGQSAASGDACREALRLLEPIGDQWGLAHAEALLGTIARSEHRLPEAVEHLTRAATAAAKLGFTAAEAHHLSNLGRVQQLTGDLPGAAGTLQDAIDKACAAGDFRAAAVARVRLARVLRGSGELASARAMTTMAMDWYGRYGGGEGALLGASTLAALDAEAGGASSVDRLRAVLDQARQVQDHEAEVLTLDALARSHAVAGELDQALDCLAQADQIMPRAAHLVFDSDRIDARRARTLVDDANRVVAPI